MGDGKSDMVRRTMQVSRPESRMLTVETDDECGEAGPENKAALFYDDTKMDSDEAVRIAKRLVPDDIVMQEVRGAEAWSLLVMMNAGVSGLATWHADEGKEHEALAEMAIGHKAAPKDQGLLIDKARTAFDVIVYHRRNTEKKFRISSIRMMAAEMEAA
jgi:Flp pilus assembly CpaF family ATPase